MIILYFPQTPNCSDIACDVLQKFTKLLTNQTWHAMSLQSSDSNYNF